jgi:hypothetical protein
VIGNVFRIVSRIDFLTNLIHMYYNYGYSQVFKLFHIFKGRFYLYVIAVICYRLLIKHRPKHTGFIYLYLVITNIVKIIYKI